MKLLEKNKKVDEKMWFFKEEISIRKTDKRIRRCEDIKDFIKFSDKKSYVFNKFSL